MNVRVIPHKRGNGKWAVDYRCPISRKRKYESFDSRKEASNRKKCLEGEYAKGTYRPLHQAKWSDFVAEFEEKKMAQMKPKTRGFYRDAIRAFRLHSNPNKMQDINTRLIDQFKVDRAWDPGRGGQGTISVATINANLRHLRAMLNVAHEWLYLPDKPSIKMLEEPEYDRRAISPHEFDSIIHGARLLDEKLTASHRRLPPKSPSHGPAHNPPCSTWWVAFISCGYLAGIRMGEILSLKWQDFRMTSKPIVRFWNQKKKRTDELPVVGVLSARVQDWANVCDDVSDRALVFPHLCHRRTLSNTWQGIQGWVGIEEPYRFHDTRVSFCTNLVNAGVEAAKLKKLARHKSLVTTLKYYQGKTDEGDRRAIEKMADAISVGK